MAVPGDEGGGGAFFPEIGLRVRVAVQDGPLAAFFVVEEEGDADFGGEGPIGVRGVFAVAWGGGRC